MGITRETEERDAEKKDFEETVQGYADSLQALEEAISILKKNEEMKLKEGENQKKGEKEEEESLIQKTVLDKMKGELKAVAMNQLGKATSVSITEMMEKLHSK